jgi:hypothetical protein
MMLISLPFAMIPICVVDPSKPYAVYNASSIWIMNMKKLVLKLTASSSGSTLIGLGGFLGSANSSTLLFSSIMRRSLSVL